MQQINNITFRDCAFVNNSGNGGSALEITPSYTEEQTISVHWSSSTQYSYCIFSDNVPNSQMMC